MLESYATQTAGLEQFRSKTGKIATAVDRYNDEEFVNNAEALPKRYFASKEGVNALLHLTGGDRKLVSKAAHEYAVNQLAGKDEAAVRNWMTQNRELMSALPDVQASVLKYANALHAGEQVARDATRKGALMAKLEGDKIREAMALADQLRAAWQREAGGITGTAEATARTLLGNEAAVSRVKTLILSGAADQWAAAGPAITASAPARQAVFDALKQTLADKVTTPQSARGIATLYEGKIQPFLESSGLLNAGQSQQIIRQLAEIQQMKLPEPERLRIARRMILQAVSGYAASVGVRGLELAIPD